MTDVSVLMDSTAGDEVSPGTVPYTKIRPVSQWNALDVSELWQYRELLITLGIREIKLRYRQTALGAAWVLLQPMLAAGIFTIVFGLIAKLPSDGPYFLFTFASLLAWNAFASMITKASACLVGNSALISKVYFPRLILPFSTLFSTVVDFAVAMGMMVVLMFCYHDWPGFRILLLPVWLVIVLILGLSCGIYCAALMVKYRDVQYVLPVFIQLGFYGTPVVWALKNLDKVPASLRPLFYLNPMSGLLEAFRWSLLGQKNAALNWGMVGYSAAFAAVSLFFATLAFRSMERRFADVI